jgi:apolipoprotein D and lipocalin family protein
MKKKIILVTMIPLLLLFLAGCFLFGESIGDTVPVVDFVDLEKYAGKWYEISSLPTWFAKNLVCVTATYTLLENGKIEVLNQGYKDSPEGKLSTITGTAWVPDPNEPARLKVSFFLWFASQYNIIALDEENYTYAMVTGKTYNFLWILSRTPQMDPNIYDGLVQQAEDWGYDISKLKMTPQICLETQ